MCVLVPLLIKYSSLVKKVNADQAGSMDDVFRVEHHAHMDDMAFFIAEKRQVARFDLREEIYQLAFLDLFGGVTGKEFACGSGAKLHKTRAVDAEQGATSPKIWDAKHFLSEINHRNGGELRGEFSGEIIGLIQQRPKGKVPAFVVEDGRVQDVPSFPFQLKVFQVADGMKLNALDPSLIVIDLCSDENP